MKKMIYVIMALCMVSLAFAAVSRIGSGKTVTYSTNEATGTITKMYWAVQDPIPSGCTGVAIASCTSSKGGCGDSYQVWTSIISNEIRIVASTNDANGQIANSVTLTLSGSGSCTLSGGSYADSKKGGQIDTVPVTPISGSVALSFGATDCSSEADTPPTCDGIKWSELDAYITAWATGTQWLRPSSHTITWSLLDTAITKWATGG